jgi:hypothetical protein
METRTLSLPGLEVTVDYRSVFGDPNIVCLDPLTKYPAAVRIGVKRELERLHFAGIPAFAEGHRLMTPHGSYVIYPDGRPSKVIPLTDFDKVARKAVRRMERESNLSANATFLALYDWE